MNKINKPYTSLPTYADVEYIDGKLKVASNIVNRTTNTKRKTDWLETIDILLDQRNALASME